MLLLPESARVLVTGGAGFVGRHLSLELIRQGYEVRLLDRRLAVNSQAEVLQGDCRHYDDCVRACRGVKVVFHQAGIGTVTDSAQDPIAAFSGNSGGTLQVLLAACAAGVERVIVASSSSVYGVQASQGFEFGCADSFAVSKLAAEEFAARCCGLSDLQVVVLRYSNIYGPGARSGVVKAFAEGIRSGAGVTILGGGSQRRDFIYISDVVNANFRAASAEMPEPFCRFDVCSGRSITIANLAQVMVDLSGKMVSIRNLPIARGEKGYTIPASGLERSRSVLGFNAVVDLESGLMHCF